MTKRHFDKKGRTVKCHIDEMDIPRTKFQEYLKYSKPHLKKSCMENQDLRSKKKEKNSSHYPYTTTSFTNTSKTKMK